MALSYPPINYSRYYPHIEYKYEKIDKKETDITKIYGNLSSIPRFNNKDADEYTQMLINLIGAPPTHAYYYCEGASSRRPASKILQSLFWIDNVAMFKRIELNRYGALLFTIVIGKSQLQKNELREPFKSRLFLNENTIIAKKGDSFATYINNPGLAAVKKNSIRYTMDFTQQRDENFNLLTDKSMITVEAYNVEKALKIWIAFLDETRDPNQHYSQLFRSDISIKDLCRLLAPLVSKFKI